MSDMQVCGPVYWMGSNPCLCQKMLPFGAVEAWSDEGFDDQKGADPVEPGSGRCPPGICI